MPYPVFFLFSIVLTKHLVSFIICITSSLVILSCQHILSNCLKIHFSIASNLLTSALRNVPVSHLYNITCYTSIFTILFFNDLLSPFGRSSFLLLNAAFACAILVYT